MPYINYATQKGIFIGSAYPTGKLSENKKIKTATEITTQESSREGDHRAVITIDITNRGIATTAGNETNSIVDHGKTIAVEDIAIGTVDHASAITAVSSTAGTTVKKTKAITTTVHE